MNRNWIRNPNRVSVEYRSGIKEFLQVASKHVTSEGFTKCPCQRCNNCRLQTLREVGLHLTTYGMSYNYTTWTHHGERRRDIPSSSNTEPVFYQCNDVGYDNDDVRDIINDLHPYASANYNDMLDEENGAMDDDVFEDDESNMHSKEFDNFETLLKESQRELYPGCEDFSVLTAVVELMHCKVTSLMSNRCFNDLLGIIKRLLPRPNNLPSSHYEANKILKGLGLGYKKIHACKYDCALFYKENEGLDKCPICSEPRYRRTSGDDKTKIPQKVLRYFPLKPRLQRLYMSTHTSRDMRWHKEGRVSDEVMRHPADGTAWKEFDKLYPDFAVDPRNVKLGLATDGFNPFNNMANPYSMWPVMCSNM